MFFETSVGSAGDKAQFASPSLTLNSVNSCLGFYYNMFGANMGTVSEQPPDSAVKAA